MPCERCPEGHWACSDQADPCRFTLAQVVWHHVGDEFLVVEIRKTGGGAVKVRRRGEPPNGDDGWVPAGVIGYHVYKGIDEKTEECVAAKLEPFEETEAAI